MDRSELMNLMGLRDSEMIDINMKPAGLDPKVWDDSAYPSRSLRNLQQRVSAYEWDDDNNLLLPTSVHGDGQRKHDPFGVLDVSKGRNKVTYSSDPGFALDYEGRTHPMQSKQEAFAWNNPRNRLSPEEYRWRSTSQTQHHANPYEQRAAGDSLAMLDGH